jgi:phosphoglycolate phosphatase
VKIPHSSSNRNHPPVLILDFDGTVADSFPIFVDLLRELAPWWHFRAPTEDEIPALREMDVPQILKTLEVSWWKVPFLSMAFRKEMHKRVDQIGLISGIHEALWALHAEGWWIDLASSNSERQVRAFWEKHQLPPTGEGTFGIGLFGKKSALEHLLRRNGWDRSAVQIAYLGDESRDIRAARSVGIEAWACTWGYAGTSILEKHQPDRLLTDPSQLLWG